MVRTQLRLWRVRGNLHQATLGVNVKHAAVVLERDHVPIRCGNVCKQQVRANTGAGGGRGEGGERRT